jgi:DNA invertase Pin-like site-specific DNA recombinase
MTPLEEARQRLKAATQEAFPPQRRGVGKRKAVIDYDQVKALTLEGRTAEQIAVTLGCSVSAITKIRIRLGITNPKHQPLTPERRAKIEDMIADEASQAEICRTVGVSAETMRKHYPDAKWSREQQNEFERIRRLESGFNWGHHKPEANAA